MDDNQFFANLLSAKLLPGDVKDEVQSMNTRAKKATHFLDCVIQPSVEVDAGGCFDTLLKLMEDSDYDYLKKLAKQIKSRLGVTSEAG